MIRKILLYPFSLVFNLITSFRNLLYEKKYLNSINFSFPIIVIGNLSVGGTGKTPHTNYLINLLKTDYDIAVLSRGYNRKTHGYIELELSSKAKNVGDEPLFYKWKHRNDIKVAVCEDRVFGISQMAINEEDKRLVFLLDDAFQHRAVKAGINIVLTEYSNLYTRDMLLPSGSLRESKKGIKRADIIVVSKCPSPILKAKKQAIREEISPKKYQILVFSSMKYNKIYPLLNEEKIIDEKETDVILVCGIANPNSLINELETRFKNVYTRIFSDHYNYKIEDIDSIIRTYDNIESKNKILLTTEKDATRLFAYKDEFRANNINLFCIPIEVFFEEEEKNTFNRAIKHYLTITLPPKQEEINTFEL